MPWKIHVFDYPTVVWRPLSNEPSRSAQTLYWQKLESLGYIFVADSIDLSSFKFSQRAPKDARVLKQSETNQILLSNHNLIILTRAYPCRPSVRRPILHFTTYGSVFNSSLQNLQCVNDELARCHQSFSNDVVLRNSVASCIAKRWPCKNYLFFS